jgi:hypothetical protein
MLDRARAAGNLASGYREVYFGLAALAAIVGVLAAFLRPPRAIPSTLTQVRDHTKSPAR